MRVKIAMAIATLVLFCSTTKILGDAITPDPTPMPTEEVTVVEVVFEEVEPTPTPEPSPEPVATPAPRFTTDEIELIALVTMAEAEGEPEEGKRLVIDTILNRVDSPYFPNTVYEVVYQKNQFTSMWNGRSDRCYVREDIVRLVEEEIESRYNYDCIFFRTSHYSQYGVPMFQVGHHYFSSYD